MISSRQSAILGLVALLAITPRASAQQPTPHIGYVFPAGGRQGASLEVTIGGQFLDGAAQAFVSGPGVEASVVEHVKPITPNQANKLKERLAELQKKERTAEVIKEIAEIRRKLATFVRRPPNPAIAETVTLRIQIASNAEPGQRELRLRTNGGLTNPLVFCVGQLPEVSEKAAKGLPPPGEGKGAKYRKFLPSSGPAGPVEITLPVVVNGQILPGGVDRYRFQARKGQRLVAVASARELIPYLADAVPGWFQAAMALYDAQGNELAYVDDYRFHPDPVLFCEIPEDGAYVLEIRDAIYRGREDFVYRIAVGELPFVTSVFPLGGKAGAKTTVELAGWNLPETSLVFDARARQPGIYPIAVRKEGLISNVVPFKVDALPECLEREPNSQRSEAQEVTLPVIVNGRIDAPGDWDLFRFEGRAGQEVVAEVYARRLGSPVDSLLRLTDATGKQLALNDDHEDKGTGLLTHHADSWLRAKLPAEGTYYLHLGDTQDHGGPEYAYRLRISSPRPDFELRIVPSTVNARSGATLPITVYAVRRDGFSGEIALELKDAPRGFALSGNRIPAGQDELRLTLTVPAGGLKEPLALRVEGRATIGGRAVSRTAVPADDLMQAFAYRHLVPAGDLEVLVGGRSFLKSPVPILSQTPIKIPAGGTARLRIGLPAGALDRIQIDLSDPPEGISIKDVAASFQGTEIVLQSDPAKVKPGLKGNLIVTVYAKAPAAKKKPQVNLRRAAALTTLPAVPFEVVAR